MKDFVYDVLPSKNYFGVGTINKVKDAVEELSINNVLVITTPGKSGKIHAQNLKEELGERCNGIYPKAVQHVPINVAKEAIHYVNEKKIDGLISIGGGSTVGLAKAIALETSLPIIAIPTNYSGSEMTHVWGITENGIKTTGHNPVVKPKVVIFDPELTTDLPVKLSVLSSINAMAHSVEALYSENSNPVSSIMAEEAIRTIVETLPRLQENPNDLQIRTELLYGAWLSGTVLDTVRMGVHHRICHTLGGSYNLSHSDTHTIILPHAVHYIKDYSPEAMEAISRAFGSKTDNVPGLLYDFIQSLDGPVALKNIGMKEEDIEQAAMIATRKPLDYPRQIDKDSIKELIWNAFIGKRPS